MSLVSLTAPSALNIVGKSASGFWRSFFWWHTLFFFFCIYITINNPTPVSLRRSKDLAFWWFAYLVASSSHLTVSLSADGRKLRARGLGSIYFFTFKLIPDTTALGHSSWFMDQNKATFPFFFILFFFTVSLYLKDVYLRGGGEKDCMFSGMNARLRIKILVQEIKWGSYTGLS